MRIEVTVHRFLLSIVAQQPISKDAGAGFYAEYAEWCQVRWYASLRSDLDYTEMLVERVMRPGAVPETPH